MELEQVKRCIIDPAMALLPTEMDSTPARVMLLAIGLQESRFEHLHQIKGPAHGYWQFERGGGLRGVMRHRASRSHARKVAESLGHPFEIAHLWDQLDDPEDQVLACAYARLLLWTDPKPLPHDAYAGWLYYERVWRPGKPHPETWPELYQRAQDAVQ